MNDFDLFINALINGNLDGLKQSFQLDFFDRTITNSSKRPIHLACQNGQTEFVKYFIENNCNLEMETNSKNRPIHLACKNGHLEVMKLLINNNCNIESENKEEQRAIHLACLYGYFDIVKLLIDNRCILQARNINDMLPFHIACQNGYCDIIKLLIINKCNIEIKTKQGLKAIDLAIMNGHLNVVRLLIDNNCDIDNENKWKYRLIHRACFNNYLDIVRLLINRNCDIEVETKRKYRSIHLACKNGHYEIAKLLININCDIDCVAKWGTRPIHFACKNGHVNIVRLLVEAKCEIEGETKWKFRPIHFACKNGHFKVVKYLLENKCDIESETSLKYKPLHLACVNGYLDITELLIKYNSNVECENEWEARPLHIACIKGHLDIINLLIKRKCEIHCKSDVKGDATPLNLAIKYKHKSCVEYIERCINQIDIARKIFDCIRTNDVNGFRKLYHEGLLGIQEYDTDLTLLEVALQNRDQTIVNDIISKKVSIKEILYLSNLIRNNNLSDVGTKLIQECLLHRSIRDQNAEGFHKMCSAYLINGRMKIMKSSFLETASCYGSSAFIEEILKKSLFDKETWERAKCVAIEKGHFQIARSISNRESLLKSREESNLSILHTSICDNDPDMTKYIIQNNLVDVDSNQEVVGTALALAHILCFRNCIEVLQQFTINCNTSNKYLETPLHEAISCGMTDYCEFLIENSTNLDIIGFMGLSPIHCAVMKGYEYICELLVKKGADIARFIDLSTDSIEKLDKSFVRKQVHLTIRENPLTLCIKFNQTLYPCFINMLDVNTSNTCDGNGDSLLHLSVNCLNLSLCRFILHSGGFIDKINNDGQTCLSRLLCNNNISELTDYNAEKVFSIFQLLIDKGANLNNTKEDGTTIIQSAFKCRNERIMMSLLSNLPQLTNFNREDFKLFFTKNWLDCVSTLMNLLSKDILSLFITSDIIHSIQASSRLNLLKSLFENANNDVQQEVIYNLLIQSVLKDNGEMFDYLINSETFFPRILENGETLLTFLIKEIEIKYCWKVIHSKNSKTLINYKNSKLQTPLQSAIEIEAMELVDHLVFESVELNNEDLYGDTPIMMLLKKISNYKNINMEYRFIPVIKSMISRGGDIYMITTKGEQVINSCCQSSVRTEIEYFFQQENNKVKDNSLDMDISCNSDNSPQNKICSVCRDKEVDCVLQCGHTFCMTCGYSFSTCPFCKCEPTKARRIFFN